MSQSKSQTLILKGLMYDLKHEQQKLIHDTVEKLMAVITEAEAVEAGMGFFSMAMVGAQLSEQEEEKKK